MQKLIWLRTVCRKNGLLLGERQLELIEKYVSLLLDWNKKINLISRRDEENIWERHILHSVAMLFKLGLSPAARVLDLGAGGGLPSVPIKVILETLQLTCLDSTKKKTVALENILQQLSLTDVQVVWGRAEELGKEKKFRSKYDYVFSRAVGSLDDLIKWSAPFLTHGDRSSDAEATDSVHHLFPVPAGSLIAWKGGELEKELAATGKMKSVRSITVIPLVFEGSEIIEARDKQLVIVSLN